jgi:cell division protein FtsL
MNKKQIVFDNSFYEKNTEIEKNVRKNKWQNKKLNFKKFKYRVILISVFCFLLAVFLNVFSQQGKMLSSEKESLKQVEALIKREKQTNTDLQKYKDSLNTDEIIEKIAREKLDMVKPGEKVIVDVN